MNWAHVKIVGRETRSDVDRFSGVATDGKGKFVTVGRDRVILSSKDNGATWGQLGSYPAKGGFFGLLQTAERIIGVGTFKKDSAPGSLGRIAGYLRRLE